jgi:hypothetical protein
MTTAVEIETTDEKALATLREVVAERPEYVYSCPTHMQEYDDDLSCFYVHTDEDGSMVSAGCVVGVALNRLGMPLEELAKEEGSTAHAVISRYFPLISKRVRARFNDIQMHQDAKNTWGVSYAKAMGETI